MKKILFLLTLSILILTSSFATIEKKNVILDANVNEILYSFDLEYSGESVNSDNESLKNKRFNLADSSTQTTETFFLKRSLGNLSKNLEVGVDIKTDAFVGDINGKEVVTSIIPQVELHNDNSNKYESIENIEYGNSKEIKFSVTIPYGANRTSNIEIASFTLNVTGIETTDAGTYTSNVVVNYTYDQNR